MKGNCAQVAMVLATVYMAAGFVSAPARPGETEKTEGGEDMAMTVTSTAFIEGSMIPSVYTCDGKDISPPLSWSAPPEGTVSLALIADDPDAPGRTWVHWVVYNIPADVTGFDEHVPKAGMLDNGAVQGKTDFGSIGYGGPCPPSGVHRYYFKLYALDCTLNLTAGATKRDLLKAIEGHILASSQLMGRYSRR